MFQLIHSLSYSLSQFLIDLVIQARLGCVRAAAAVLAATAMALPARAAMPVLACEPEWAALVRELAGDQAQVYLATHALQDPHRVEARPSLVAAARRAALLVCTGAELEVGWLPILVQQSGNPQLLPGAPGYFEAADAVEMLELPTRLDRADGDVHPGGNPHIQTDPRNIARVARALAQRLATLDPPHAELYAHRHADFQARWSAAIQRWERQAAPLKGTAIVVQHQGFPYLQNWLGLNAVAALEAKPGVEPSSAYLSQLLGQLRDSRARFIVRAAYSEGRGAQWLAERTKLPIVVLPYTVGGNAQAQDLFSLFDDTVARLLDAASGQARP